MKTKQSVFALVAIAALAFASCGGNETSSSGVAKKSLFGDIPELYEEKAVDLLKEAASMQGKEASMGEALGLVAKMQVMYEEAGKEAQPLADKLVGEKVAYELSDSLSYQLVSDIEVKKVSLPEYALFGGGEQTTRLHVNFDIVMTQNSEEYIRLYYLIMDDDTPIGYGSCSGLGKHAVGDTIHVKDKITAPDVPAKYAKACNMLKFVTEYTYYSQRDALREQAKKWNEELEAKYGIKKEDDK